MTIGSSIVLIAIGAILRWAVTASVKGFDIQTAGLVLLIVGIVGLCLSVLYTFVWSRQRRTPPTTYPSYEEHETRRYQ